MFSEKAISRALCFYFLVKIALQMTLIKYLLPEAALGIDEKATEETADQNFSNKKFLTTGAAHTPMTPPFLLFFGVLKRFLTYLMTSLVGTKNSGLKPIPTGNLLCDIPTLSDIW